LKGKILLFMLLPGKMLIVLSGGSSPKNLPLLKRLRKVRGKVF